MATTGTLDVAHESAVAIYDARTGEIVHRHEVLTLRGGEHPDAKTLERDARAAFAQMQPGFKAKTAVLHFDPRGLKTDVLYKINVKTQALVEKPLRKRASGGKGKGR